MSQPWTVASITGFEQIPVGAAGALLRVAAVTGAPGGPDATRPTLVADDGDVVSYFAALPAPPDEGNALRCAFSVPAELVADDTVFSLELDDGNLIALPAPFGGEHHLADATGRLADAPDALAPGPPAATVGALPVDPAVPAPVLDLLLDAAEARAELQAMRELATVGRAGAPAPHAGSGGGQGQLAEMQVWSAELERRLADTTTELAEVRAQLELHRAQADLAARRRASAAGAQTVAVPAGERAEIGAAAVAEARRRAERDLADAAS